MYTPKGYLGFESRSLRKTFIIKESASQKRCWFRFGGQAVESLLSRGLLPQNGIAALRAAQLLDGTQFCKGPRGERKGSLQRSEATAQIPISPLGNGSPGCNAPGLLLPHAPEQITAHKAEIYPSDTQAIRILAPARWHQFGFTAQHQNFYLAHNQYVRKSRHAW